MSVESWGITSAFWVLVGKEGSRRKKGKRPGSQAWRGQGGQRGGKGRIEEEEKKRGERESKKEAERGEIRRRIGKGVEEEGRGERERRQGSRLLLQGGNGTREGPRLVGGPWGASCLGCGFHSHREQIDLKPKILEAPGNERQEKFF